MLQLLQDNALVLILGGLVIILLGLLLAKNFKAKLNGASLNLEKNEGKDNIEVSDVSGQGTTVETTTKDGQNQKIKKIKDGASVKINQPKKDKKDEN